ncbi:MAG: PAS domain-containing protein [Bdellovibrionales bacterium]|nr:PAS domain-containing protein [Bdellovibrionales bacterium]
MLQLVGLAHTLQESHSPKRVFLQYLFLSLLTILIFCVDLELQLGMAVPVLYLVVVWFGYELRSKSGVLIFTFVSIILVVLGAVYSPGSFARHQEAMFNRSVSILALVIFLYFLLSRYKTDEKLLRLYSLINKSTNIIVSCDTENNIAWFNQAFQDTFNIENNVIGNDLVNTLDIFSDDKSQIESLRKILLQNESFFLEMDFQDLKKNNLHFKIEGEIAYNKNKKRLGYTLLFTDISIEKNIQNEIKEELDYTASVLDNISFPVIVLDQDQEVEFANKNFYSFFKVSNKIEGRKFSELFKNNINFPDIQLILDELSDEQASKNTILEDLFIAGDAYIFGITLKKLATGDKKIIIGLTDIGELRTALHDLENSNEDLRQFTSVASHDLKEPLRKISSFLEILKEDAGEKLTQDELEYVDFAVSGANRLKNLIDDLLSFNQIAHDGPGKILPTSSLTAVQTAIDNLELQIKETKAEITIGSLPNVQAFSTLLTQLFQNLISNAIKYIPNGVTPKIEINAQTKGRFVEFSIKDNGIGIKKEYQQKIFKIFKRLHSRSEYSGTGIGLAVCKKIIERHGGSIWLESEPGQGTCFFFTIRRQYE